MKRLGGIARQRPMPKFAEQTFKQWLGEHGADHERTADTQRGRVILWADTFNNHFTPATLRAAYEVLEDAGFAVTVPSKSLCCGRPLYDHGFLGMAKKLLRKS